MSILLGNYSLAAAVLAAAVVLLACLAARRLDEDRFYRAARWAMGAVAALFTLASAALLWALAGDDFRLTYITLHSEKSLPMAYKLAAFWAGQEGSLLLWAWMLAVMGGIVAWQQRRRRDGEHLMTLAAMATVTGFFALLMFVAANPFALAGAIALDGKGLNPLLQDPAMVAHPPMLFLGYAGYTVPFAMLLGALAAGKLDNQWLANSRPWLLLSWLFLTVGILLGSWWAYIELGWGGYWAWDPVENASLLPWLTGTALLHSAIGQRQRGMFKRWNAALVAVTFILCIFGTYLTRSGVVSSQHSFGKSVIGDFFLVFLALLAAATIAFIAWRWRAMRPDRRLEGLISREGTLLGANVLLVGMMLVTLIGTIWPVFSSQPVEGQQAAMSVTQSFYNHTVLPMGLMLIALMALGPLLGYGQSSAAKLVRGLAGPVASALAAAIAAALLGISNPWALVCAGIAGLVAASIAIDTARSVADRASGSDSAIGAALRFLDANHRKYGAYIAHLGMVMVAVGIVGSSLYTEKQALPLAPGQSATLGRYEIKFHSLTPRRHANYTAYDAHVTAATRDGRTLELHPQRRIYDKSEQPMTEVAIEWSWREDLYLTLAGWEPATGITTIQAIINPLVFWIWAGGVALVLGALICLVPRFVAVPATAVKEDEHPIAPARGFTPSPAMKTIALLIASLLALPALAQPLALPQDHPAPAPGQRRPMGMGMMPPNHPDISSMMPTSRPAATHGSLTVRAIQGSAGGGPVAGDAVTVELFHQGQAINRIEKQLDASGVLVLEKLPLDLPFQPIARIRHAGLDYQQVGREMHGHNANQQLDITVFEQTDQAPAWQVRNRHVIIKPVEQGLGITEMLSIESPGDRTWRGTADEKGQRTTLWLELPAGAQNITIGGGFDECCTRFENNRLLSSAPLMPGASQYQVSYILAPSSGQLRMAIKNPAPAKHLMLAVPDDGTTAKVEGMKLFRVMPGQNGNMRIYQAADLAAGQETSVTFSGLASGKTVSNAMKVSASSLPKVIVAVVAGVVLLLGVSIMFIKPKAAGKKA